MIGTGHVGLVTGACLASIGHEILSVDQDESKIEVLSSEAIPIYEPGLDSLVAAVLGTNCISFAADPVYAVQQAEIICIAVGTPQASDGRSDLNQVETAAKQISKAANGDKIVVVKSTIPVGTCRRVSRNLGKHGEEHKFFCGIQSRISARGKCDR